MAGAVPGMRLAAGGARLMYNPRHSMLPGSVAEPELTDTQPDPTEIRPTRHVFHPARTPMSGLSRRCPVRAA